MDTTAEVYRRASFYPRQAGFNTLPIISAESLVLVYESETADDRKSFAKKRSSKSGLDRGERGLSHEAATASKRGSGTLAFLRESRST